MKQKLFEQITIGTKQSKNRIVMPPMETRMSTPSGDVSQNMIDYYAERAKGGAGVIIVENTFVDNIASRGSYSSSGLYSNHLISGKNLLAEAIKKYGALAIIQIGHNGRQAKEGMNEHEAVAPSAVMCSVTKRMPHALTVPEIIEIEDAFAETALRAQFAGFDGIELHGAHGYLLCSFLSPLTNIRTDQYGGSLKNRSSFASNIIEKIRKKTGKSFIVGYRISASEFIKGGLEPDEACRFVESVQDNIDYVHVSGGIYESTSFWIIAPVYIPGGQLIEHAAKMKSFVNIPVIAVSSITPEMGEEVLKQNKADMIAFGRALIADPFLPKKLLENRKDEIRPCIRGNEGCTSRFPTGLTIRCEVNPACGQESSYKIRRTSSPRKIVVAGGGVAGLEASRISALIGNEVVLFEKTEKLGGHLTEISKLEFKTEELSLLDWLTSQVKKNGVRIFLNTVATPEIIAGEKPDILIIATGSEYIQPSPEEAKFVSTADKIIKNSSLAGEKVIIIGGGIIGSETALKLALEGHSVTILEMTSSIAANQESDCRDALVKRLNDESVDILTGHKVTEIKKGLVKAIDGNGTTVTFGADTIVLATGLVSSRHPELESLAPLSFHIGDCVQPRKIFHCMYEAWNVFKEIFIDDFIEEI
jgi:2,4-dienoyl-CoA reductase-like NADH-dependent reductase (Old Yellow Enzyme family)/thioredoxin reductase